MVHLDHLLRVHGRVHGQGWVQVEFNPIFRELTAIYGRKAGPKDGDGASIWQPDHGGFGTVTRMPKRSCSSSRPLESFLGVQSANVRPIWRFSAKDATIVLAQALSAARKPQTCFQPAIMGGGEIYRIGA